MNGGWIGPVHAVRGPVTSTHTVAGAKLTAELCANQELGCRARRSHGRQGLDGQVHAYHGVEVRLAVV